MRVQTDAGAVMELGETEATATIGITDFSRRVTDDFGVTTVVERGFARRMSVRLGVPFEEVDSLQRRLADLRATSALWVADDRFASLSVRGFYKDFNIDLAVPPLSYCTLTVEGLAEAAPAADPGGDPAPIGSTSTLQLLQPAIITNSVLTASSVAENDAAEWAAGTSYPLGARVIRTATHRLYESVVGGNVGNDPAGATGKWLDLGPTNRWAMFDQALGTATSAGGSIVVTLDAGTAGAVALLDVSAASVRVQANGYDRTLATGAGAITFLDLPSAGPVTVTVAGPDTVSVGTLLIGRLVNLGLTEASPTAGIADFSRKVVDDFGDVTLLQRAWAKRMSARALIRTDAIDAVANRIAAVRALPSLWIGQAGLDSLTIYGFFKDFSIEVGQTVSKLSLSIEGLSKAAKVQPLATSVDWADLTDKTGTKPLPNADKTSENTSKDTSAVGGRPVEQVITDIDINTDAILEEGLRQDDLVRVVEARTFVEGQPVATRFLDFRNEQTGKNEAFASKFALVGAETSDGTGWVLNLDAVRVDENKTLVERLNEAGLQEADVTAKITDYDKIVSPRLGKIEATRTVAIDINGNIVGTQLVGSEDGPGSFNLINADLRMGTGRVIFNNGTVMRVQGVAFGANGDLISWFGPTMALADCSRTNAISYEATDGDAYFGGSLSAGALRNARSTTLLDADAALTLGPFHSDGGEISVVLSYSYQRSYRCNSGTGGITGDGAAAVALHVGDAAGPLLTTLSVGETIREVIVDGEPGVPDQVRWAMGGSVTIKWTPGITDFAQLLGKLVSRSFPTLLGQSIVNTSMQQLITIVGVEK